MTNQTQEETKGGTYSQIYLDAEAISRDVESHTGTPGFEEYISRLNKIQRRYIQDFEDMGSQERQDASLLLDMLREQIHGRLDVFRARAMRGELKPKK